MTKLSVNINKVATIRNARGGKLPHVPQFAKDIENMGAQGVTVHPRPDERHITYNDCIEIAPNIKTEFNIEGNPNPKFIDLVLEVKPHQVTLVPDAPDAITSNAGWDTIIHQDFLKEIITLFKSNGIRTSIFIDTDSDLIKAAATTGTDRVELYTEKYAVGYENGNKEIVKEFAKASELAHKLGMGVNAGHDLNLDNLAYFTQNVPYLDEVSIGHALISDALYLGIENTIQAYLKRLKK